MPEQVEDFWPRDLGAMAAITPVTILKEQAALLGRKTKNLVEGAVRTSVEQGTFWHSLYLRVPVLADYAYKLLTVSQDARFYPLHISDLIHDQRYEIHDLETFKDRLRMILSSPEVKQVIDNLLAYAENTAPQPG